MTQRMQTAERQEQLADAALRLLSREGASALTVRRIAQQVGITEGAVFRHFVGKEQLLDAAVDLFAARLTPLPPEHLPPVERLGRFFVERTTAVQAQPEVLGLAMSERLQTVLGESSAHRLRGIMQESFQFVVEGMGAAKKVGQLPPNVDPKVAAWMMTGAMRGAARSGADVEKTWADVKVLLFEDQGFAEPRGKDAPKRKSVKGND